MRCVNLLALIFLFNLALGAQSPSIVVEGSIQLAMDSSSQAEEGTIRWNGNEFEGWSEGIWWTLNSPRFRLLREATFKVRSDSVMVLSNIEEYTVPKGWNLYITGLRGSSCVWHVSVDDHIIPGINTNLSRLGHHWVLGENMTIKGLDCPLNIYGYLTPKTIEFFIHDLAESPITAPQDASIFVAVIGSGHSDFNIEGMPIYNLQTVYPGTQLSATSGIIMGCYMR